MRKRKVIKHSPLGKRIRDLREAKGLFQRDLAVQLGIAQSTVGKMEQGEIVPNIERVQAIANLLDVRVSYLLEGEPDESATCA